MKALLEIVKFEVTDVITTSGPACPGQGTDDEF